VSVGTAVGICVSVGVGVPVGAGVNVTDGVGDGTSVSVAVGEGGTGVSVGVNLAEAVAVGISVGMGVAEGALVGVKVGDATGGFTMCLTRVALGFGVDLGSGVLVIVASGVGESLVDAPKKGGLPPFPTTARAKITTNARMPPSAIPTKIDRLPLSTR
jgi:hypothetical protein